MAGTVPAYVPPITMCGTRAGAKRHRRLGETCETCRRAENEHARSKRHPRTPRPDLPRWEQAACRGLDTDMFFPHAEDAAGHRAAYRVCSGCPIVAACGAWALEHESHGIWGGLGQNARKRLRDGAAT